MDFSLLEFSVDMVRLQAEVKRSDFQEFFKVFHSDPNVNYKEMTAITAYRHNFYIKDLICNGKSLYSNFFHRGYYDLHQPKKNKTPTYLFLKIHNNHDEKNSYKFLDHLKNYLLYKSYDDKQ